MFTKSTHNLNIIKSLSDAPNINDGISAEELKAKFDEGVTTLQEFINGLINELEAKGSATSLGANSMYDGDTSDNNVQSKLNTLKNMIDDFALGGIPDNSLTEEKLISEFRNLIAKKSGELQVNLNAEKLGGQKLCSLYANSKYHEAIYSTSNTPMVKENAIPTMEANSQNGVVLSFLKLNSSSSCNNVNELYTLFDENYINRRLETGIDLCRGYIYIDLPFYIKINKFKCCASDTGSRSVDQEVIIEAQKGDESWVELGKCKSFNTSIEEREVDITENLYTNKLRISSYNSYSSSYSYSNIWLYKLNIDGEIVSTLDTNRLDLSFGFEEVEVGQKVSVRVPSEYRSALNGKMQIDGLGYKEIPELIPEEFVNMYYDGNKFVREA